MFCLVVSISRPCSGETVVTFQFFSNSDVITCRFSHVWSHDLLLALHVRIPPAFCIQAPADLLDHHILLAGGCFHLCQRLVQQDDHCLQPLHPVVAFLPFGLVFCSEML